jgi:hypothetical protein
MTHSELIYNLATTVGLELACNIPSLESLLVLRVAGFATLLCASIVPKEVKISCVVVRWREQV